MGLHPEPQPWPLDLPLPCGCPGEVRGDNSYLDVTVAPPNDHFRKKGWEKLMHYIIMMFMFYSIHSYMFFAVRYTEMFSVVGSIRVSLGNWSVCSLFSAQCVVRVGGGL